MTTPNSPMPSQDHSLANTLKTRTAELHHRAEQHPLQRAMLSGRIALADFARWQASMLAVHAALEPALRDLLASRPDLASLIQPHVFREQLYRADTVDLASPDLPPSPAQTILAAHIQSLAATQPVALLGCLYVLEGSTNGSKFIARVLAKTLNLADQRGIRSLDPHGDQQQPRWAAFRTALDSITLTPVEHEAVIDTAMWMFQAIIDLSEEQQPSAATIETALPITAAAKPLASLLLAGAALLCAAESNAQTITLTLYAPTLDRWMYPFASSPGTEVSASIFAPLTPAGFDPSFDNRDGQMLVAFNTAPTIPAGQSPSNYTITSLTVTLQIDRDLAFTYDPTPDHWQSWLLPSNSSYVPDNDPGRAVELFGAGYRNGFTALTFPENGPYSPVGPFGKFIRNVFPLDFTPAGLPRDVSNNVDQTFDPTPWAIGVNASLTPGQFVPIDTILTFNLNVADADIHASLQQQLSEGRLAFVIASIFPSEQKTAGTFPAFYTREHALVQLGIKQAARLAITVSINPTSPNPDLNNDGFVGAADLGILLGSWGSPGCGGASPCPADLNNDGGVGPADLGILLGSWG